MHMQAAVHSCGTVWHISKGHRASAKGAVISKVECRTRSKSAAGRAASHYHIVESPPGMHLNQMRAQHQQCQWPDLQNTDMDAAYP